MDHRIQAIQRRAAGDDRIIGLAGGLPCEAQFPKRALARSFLRVLRRSGAPLQYGWPEGSEGLRRVIAGRLAARGAEVSADDVIVTSGAQQAIAIALDLVCRPGDEVEVGAETYPSALELLRGRRLVAVAPPRRPKPRARYVMPAVDNPRGLALAERERATLLGGRVPVIEDDAYADLSFAGPAPRPLLAEGSGQVLHVGTFSKTLCPGLRIGWLVVPPRLRRRALDLKEGSDLQASSLAQAIVEDYLTGGGEGPGVDFEARLGRLRRFYRARAARLARAVRAHLPEWRFQPPAGGFSIWLEAPPGSEAVPELALLDAATEEGVTFDPGSLFRPGRGAAPLALRLCFSAAPPASFDEGVRRLARAWRRVARFRPGARGAPPRDGRTDPLTVRGPDRRWARASPRTGSADSR